MEALLFFAGVTLGLIFSYPPTPPRRGPPRPPNCRGRHRFIVTEDLSRRCVQGCHHLRGRRVVCQDCPTVSEVWDEPETAAVLFDVAPKSGVYR